MKMRMLEMMLKQEVEGLLLKMVTRLFGSYGQVKCFPASHRDSLNNIPTPTRMAGHSTAVAGCHKKKTFDLLLRDFY